MLTLINIGGVEKKKIIFNVSYSSCSENEEINEIIMFLFLFYILSCEWEYNEVLIQNACMLPLLYINL